MIISIPCPSAPHPIGGVTALYEFGNGLCRRGHEVHLVHGDFFGSKIESLDDLAWFDFEPGIRHHHCPAGDGVDAVPDADVYFGTGAPGATALPVMLVQGADMLFPWLERAAFRTPCLKVCIASWLVDSGLPYGVPPEQLHVVPMGIDHARYVVRTPLAERTRTVSMLYNEHPAKGWDVGRQALIEARRRVPDLQAIVFGTARPPDLDQLPPWITFFLDPEEQVLIDDVYNASRVFVQASDHEGFGFTAVEAMACGAALVSTDNGGSRDYALSGETALLAQPRDHAKLADHVVRLLQDDPYRVALASAGERYVRRFDWDRGAAELERLLLAYLADPPAFLQEPGPELASLGEAGA